MSRAPSLADALRSARGKAERTVTELALGARVSRRSLTRWESGDAVPRAAQLQLVLRALHAIDPALVPAVASAAGVDASSLGLGPRARDVRLEPRQIADSVVCAAADAVASTPAEARLALKGAFARMKEIGATIDDVAPWLEAPSS